MRTIPDAAEELCTALDGVGVRVTGPIEVEDEDHGTVKGAIVSRGLTWLTGRAFVDAAQEESQD